MLEFNTLGNILLILATIPAILSVVIYTRVKWYRSKWGVHLMTYMVTMALVLILGIVRIFFAEADWFYPLRAAVYVAMTVILWWRMAYIYEAYKESKNV